VPAVVIPIGRSVIARLSVAMEWARSPLPQFQEDGSARYRIVTGGQHADGPTQLPAMPSPSPLKQAPSTT
jgi:hypothetical protein